MPQPPKIRIDHNRQEVYISGTRVVLTTAQFRILAALKKSPGILSRTALLEKVWDGDESFEKDARTVDQHVSRLRQRLKPYAKKTTLIETVLNVGYKYTGS